MNCKPGDLAYLSSDCVAEGVIVEVSSAAPMTEYGPAWHCKSRTPIPCTTAVSKREMMATEICVADCFLRPISGVPVDDEEEISAPLILPANFDAMYVALGIQAVAR